MTLKQFIEPLSLWTWVAIQDRFGFYEEFHSVTDLLSSKYWAKIQNLSVVYYEISSSEARFGEENWGSSLLYFRLEGKIDEI